jgi:dTDP-4-dehydrorhamnose 3,5-epimerase
MDVKALEIPDAWLFTPEVHGDGRGVFLESFTRSSLSEATGRSLDLAQANISRSQRGTIRGIHFALVPPGQAKFVQCVSGLAYDVIVDVRVGSPTFGRWCAVELNAEVHQGVFISEGLGHGFAALADNTTLSYFCSTPYTPSNEFGISPFDPSLNISWPITGPTVSERDKHAPSLQKALEDGTLPTYESSQEWLTALRGN